MLKAKISVSALAKALTLKLKGGILLAVLARAKTRPFDPHALGMDA